MHNNQQINRRDTESIVVVNRYAKLIEKYDAIANEIAKAWLSHMDIETGFDEPYFIGGPGGGVFSCNDMFWHLQDMQTVLRERIDPEKAIEWYWNSADLYEKTGDSISLAAYVRRQPSNLISK